MNPYRCVCREGRFRGKRGLPTDDLGNILSLTVTSPTKASAEPVNWRRRPRKARRKGEGEPEEEKGRGGGKRPRGGREVGVGRRNTVAKGRRRPELTRPVARESALQAAGRAGAKARSGPVKEGSAECKGRRGGSEGTDGSSPRQTPGPKSGADSGFPRTTTLTLRGWGLRESLVPRVRYPAKGCSPRAATRGRPGADPALTLSSPRLSSLPPLLLLLNQFPGRLCPPGPLPETTSLPPQRHPYPPGSPLEPLKILT